MLILLMGLGGQHYRLYRSPTLVVGNVPNFLVRNAKQATPSIWFGFEEKLASAKQIELGKGLRQPVLQQ